jgi:Fur family peroxide stress response transcriptional regulator
VDKEARRRRLEAFEEVSRERGLPVTLQRRAILETVLDIEGHPTADDVHEALADRHPGISRTTVYRSLETLATLGVITKVCHPGRATRYDRRTEIHHHLVCMRCEGIADFSDGALDGLPVPDTSAEGFEVWDHRVQLRGICKTCRERED